MCSRRIEANGRSAVHRPRLGLLWDVLEQSTARTRATPTIRLPAPLDEALRAARSVPALSRERALLAMRVGVVPMGAGARAGSADGHYPLAAGRGRLSTVGLRCHRLLGKRERLARWLVLVAQPTLVVVRCRIAASVGVFELDDARVGIRQAIPAARCSGRSIVDYGIRLSGVTHNVRCLKVRDLTGTAARIRERVIWVGRAPGRSGGSPHVGSELPSGRATRRWWSGRGADRTAHQVAQPREAAPGRVLRLA